MGHFIIWRIQFTDKSGIVADSGRLWALKHSNLKECRLVRYADDFKIFCRKRQDAEKLFIAVKKWLKERLGLDISPEKSKIVNLREHYSYFLGFKLKVIEKGKYSNGEKRYVIYSHISDKASKNIHLKAKQYLCKIQYPDSRETAYKAVQNYNAFVMGVHNYYRLATNVSCDFARIAYPVLKSLKTRLKGNISSNGICSSLLKERYGKSSQLMYVYGFALIPISYVQHKAPLNKKNIINKYTAEGRKGIHKKLEAVDMNVLYEMMKNPVKQRSIEYNDNRLSLYCAQKGRCAITKQILKIGKMHCHHKIPVKQGGKDNYNNLILLTDEVHILLHSIEDNVIKHYMDILKLNHNQLVKLNKMRKSIGLEAIQ